MCRKGEGKVLWGGCGSGSDVILSTNEVSRSPLSRYMSLDGPVRRKESNMTTNIVHE